LLAALLAGCGSGSGGSGTAGDPDEDRLVADFSAVNTSGVAPLDVTFIDESSEEVMAWTWDFGDGSSADVPDPMHTYTAPGIYSVALSVRGPNGVSEVVRPGLVEVFAPTDAPDAAFHASVTEGVAPLSVSFTDDSTGEVTDWIWSFGDGDTSFEQNPTYVYQLPGVYSVTLNIAGPAGADITRKPSYITVHPPSANPPQAQFSGTNTSGTAPLSVSFTDQSTGDVTGWAWTFGDGGTSTQRNPTRTYQSPGTYNVTLRVTGPAGNSQLTKSGFVNVSDAPEAPQAVFSATNTSGDAPLMVTFSDQSTGDVTGWSWTFGDGGTSTQRNPTRTYQNPGTYGVTLRVTGPAGTSQVTQSNLVRVFDANAQGVWASPAELQVLPMSGAAWNNVLDEANRALGTPDVANQDDDADVRILAKAIAFARTGQQTYRQQVIAGCMDAIGSEAGGRTLALGRNLIGYVIAADLVGLPAAEEALFRDWLEECRTNTYDGKTLTSTHEERPNNWGTHAGGSRVAVAAYLGDTAELARCAQVFKGWLGDRSAYSGFSYGDLSWQSDPSRPVGINPRGATIQGHDVDGVLPDDQRRGGGFTWPPPKENYVWEALQGALAQAVILARNGYPDVWNWSDQALLRAVDWLHAECNYPAESDDTWQPHVVNYFYGSSFPAPVPSNPGKNVGWTDFTLQ
jgi:PKD repeat protein